MNNRGKAIICQGGMDSAGGDSSICAPVWWLNVNQGLEKALEKRRRGRKKEVD